MPRASVSGSFWILFQYDVCEEIRLKELREFIGAPPAGRKPSFRHPVPEYVRFERPPVVESLDPLTLGSGAQLQRLIQYYDYGVVSIELELPFAFEWPDLVNLANACISDPELERQASDTLHSQLNRIAPALVKPYDYRLSEDYYVVQVSPIDGDDGAPMSAAQLIAGHAVDIARIVRGELIPLAEEERAEVMQARLSYYPGDLLVAGWNAAFVYDTAEGAAPVIQLLGYANTQLLEFRHYDHLLNDLLSGVYRSLDRGTGVLARWRMAREAERLNTIRLEVRELTGRIDNSIKFLSDMFSARVYRLAAARIGVPDYRRLVEADLNTAGELYQFMRDRFYQGRAFVLELMVVVILIIELVYLFRGKV